MIYCIGDIHGMNGLLKELLNKILPRLNAGDTLVFLGDYIDRGPDSKGVLLTLMGLKNKYRCIFLRGNHEQFMLDAAEDAARRVGKLQTIDGPTAGWLSNGGWDTLNGFGVHALDRWAQEVPHAFWEFLEATELEYVTEQYHFVHAGLVPPGVAWLTDGPLGTEPRLWIREPFLSSEADFGGRVVVFGHTPSREPLVMRNKIGIDTDACRGGALTCVVLPETFPCKPEFLQVREGAVQGRRSAFSDFPPIPK